MAQPYQVIPNSSKSLGCPTALETLDFAEPIAAPPATDRNAIYKNVTGITLRPQAIGVSSSGFFPTCVCVTDPGFVEIDDIAFVTQ